MYRTRRAVVAALACTAGTTAFRTRHKSPPAKEMVDNDQDGLDDNFEMACAQKFKPVMYLHSDEVYGPNTVEEFLKTCHLRKEDSCSKWNSLVETEQEAEQESNATNFASCPYATSVATRLAKCWWRDRDEDLGQASVELLAQHPRNNQLYLRCLGCNGRSCNNMGRNNEGSNGVRDEEGLRRVPFYVHVLPDNRFERPMVHIQYWFFYPFNGPTISFGVHQGDWEHLSMLVDDTCTTRLKYRWQSHGATSGWLDEGSDPAVEYENGAMVSYSALNSHAGFMTEGEHEGGTVITKDYTNKGKRWYPDELVNPGETTCPGGAGKPMSNATAFLDFHGSWGTDSAFDGVLTGIPTVGALCPGGPRWGFNHMTPKQGC